MWRRKKWKEGSYKKNNHSNPTYYSTSDKNLINKTMRNNNQNRMYLCVTTH